MALSCAKFQFQNFSVAVAHVLRTRLLQRSSVLTTLIASTQVRHKNNSRVRDAKVDVDRSRKFISKKERRKALQVQTAIEEEITHLADSPVDNVWVRKYYPQPKYTIEETVERHKLFAQPDMLDNMDGLVYLDMRLDFTTKKQTKFMSNIRHTLLLPHVFPCGSPPDILVFCKSEEDLALSATLGAKHYGTPAEIIKLINNAVISPKDFAHVLCTADCGNEILTMRSLFRDKFPQRAKGNMSPDLKNMWDLFYNGYTYESQKLTQRQGRMQVPLGLLMQPTEELAENFQAYIQSICQHRSITLGPFIQSIKVVAPPSPEEFLVKVEDYVPGYQNEEVDSDEEDAAAEN